MVSFPIAVGVKAVLITTFLKVRESHNLTILLPSSSPFVTLSRMAVWIVFVVLLWCCLIVMWLLGWAVVQHWGWCLGVATMNNDLEGFHSHGLGGILYEDSSSWLDPYFE